MSKTEDFSKHINEGYACKGEFITLGGGILDGEAVPEGGMGVARQLKDEVFNCLPVLRITGRAQDNWLATWSRAEATVTHPIDPFTLAKKCADLLKNNIDLNLSNAK